MSLDIEMVLIITQTILLICLAILVFSLVRQNGKKSDDIMKLCHRFMIYKACTTGNLSAARLMGLASGSSGRSPQPPQQPKKPQQETKEEKSGHTVKLGGE